MTAVGDLITNRVLVYIVRIFGGNSLFIWWRSSVHSARSMFERLKKFLICCLLQGKCRFAIISFLVLFLFRLFCGSPGTKHSARLVLSYQTLGNHISFLCLRAIFVQLKLQSVAAAALCCRCTAVDLELRGRRDPQRHVWMSGDLHT